MANANHQTFSKITYSCYSNRVSEGEQFIPEHVFSYQISGQLIYKDGKREFVFDEGSFRLTRRNTLVKFSKIPAEKGDYSNISIFLNQKNLRDLSLEFGYQACKNHTADPYFNLPANPFLNSFIESLKPYDNLINPTNVILQNLKLKELIVILLQTNPYLIDVLFDFTEPGKIDLESFMNKNFRYNVPLERFAYLTGRSLSTFKRDFEKIFIANPRKWLQEKRLQEAYFLINEKGASVSEVYIDVGFQNLSHFSFAFKKMYGFAPSQSHVESYKS